jgi:hypothetical protein
VAADDAPVREALGAGRLDVVLRELVARQRHGEAQAHGAERRADDEPGDQQRAQPAPWAGQRRRVAVWVEEIRQMPDAEGRREEQQQREAHHVHRRAEGEHRRGLEGARSARAWAGRAPHACRHAAEDPEEQAAAQEPEVDRIAARPQVADLGTAPEHARLAEVEVQQRAVEVVAQAAPEGRARVLLRA